MSTTFYTYEIVQRTSKGDWQIVVVYEYGSETYAYDGVLRRPELTESEFLAKARATVIEESRRAFLQDVILEGAKH